MTWTKIDDQLHSHPKVQCAWQSSPVAVGLHLLALSHSAAHLTDGHVSEAFVRQMVPGAAARRRAIAALLSAPPPFAIGLWERAESGWQIHDYLDFNESREHVLKRRRDDVGRKGVRTESARTPDGIHASHASAQPSARVRAQPRGPAPTPFPTPEEVQP